MEHKFMFNDIHIIESIPEEEIQTGSIVYPEINRIIKDNKCKTISINFQQAITKNDFLNIIKSIGNSASYKRVPLIHIECHGSISSLALASGENIPFPELTPLFQEINTRTFNNLLVVCSACFGQYLSKIIIPSFSKEKRSPLFGVFGPTSISIPSMLIDNNVHFYELLFSNDITKYNYCNLRKYLDNKSLYTMEFISPTVVFYKAFKNVFEQKKEDLDCPIISLQHIQDIKNGVTFLLERGGAEQISIAMDYFNTAKNSFFMYDIYPFNFNYYDVSFNNLWSEKNDPSLWQMTLAEHLKK